MKFEINNAEKERQKTLKFAKDNNISDDEINEVYDKIYNELPDDLSDNAKELRALRKTRGALRRIVNSNINYVDSFIFMRFRDSDYNVNAWNKVDKFIKENGKDKAKERGMIDEEGNYIHTSYTTQFDNQMGKVIDKKDARGHALGIFQGDEGTDIRFLTIGKFNVWDNIPICREISVNVKDAGSAGKVFPNKNQYYLNGARSTSVSHYYSAEDFQSYADMIEDGCGDIFFSLKSDVDDYAKNNANDPFNYLAVFCTVNRIGTPLDDGTVPVEFEPDDEVFTTWATKNIFKDLTIEEGITGLAFINTYINNSGVVGYRLGGFLPLADE